MSELMLELSIGLIFFFLTGGLFLIHRAKEKKRSEAFAEIAAKLGFSFSAESGMPDSGLGGYPIAERGNSHSVANAMSGELDGTPFILCEHSYSTGSGKNRRTYRHTGAVFRSPRPLPRFSLEGEDFLERMAQAVFGDDVDFPEDEAFSKRYQIKSKEAAGVRELFHPGARAHLLNAGKEFSLESDGQGLFVYCHDARAEPPEAYAFLVAAKAVFDSFDLR